MLCFASLVYLLMNVHVVCSHLCHCSHFKLFISSVVYVVFISNVVYIFIYVIFGYFGCAGYKLPNCLTRVGY